MPSLPGSLSGLLQRSTIHDHEEILQACNASLKQSKNDLDIRHVKLVAYLKQDRYDDALRVLEDSGDQLKKKASLEYAYTLYKVGELSEARKVAKDLEGRGARHVEAQASYRSEDFHDASNLYLRLADGRSSIENEQDDIRINSGATDTQLEWTGQGDQVQKKKSTREDLEAFETAFNLASRSISKEELGQGEKLLNIAKGERKRARWKHESDKAVIGLCNALDILNDDEKVAELVPMSVQQLYVLSRLGKLEEAEKLAAEIAIDQIPDLSTRLIAQNNLLAVPGKNSNPYLAHRLFHDAKKPPKTDKLFRRQAEQINLNSLALDLQVSKSAGIIRSTSKALSDSPLTTSAHVNSISVINAAAHAQSQLGKLGLKQILPQLDKRPNDIGLVMTIVQLYVLTNNLGCAVNVLESLIKHLSKSKTPADQDILFAPGLVALQVSLYSSQDLKSQVKTALAKAASYWRHRSKPPIALLQAAGLCLLESSDPEHQKLTQEIFENLHTQDPASKFNTAGYVAAYALDSPEKVTREAESLTPISRLTAGIDVAALEAAGVPSLPSSATSTRKRPLDEKPKPAKKRIRKSKLPKDYDPSKTPDPERWLPLRDRSTYRPKGKKGKQKAAEKTQGGVSSEKASEAKGAGSEGVIKAPEKPGAAQGKGKKKKGKK